MQINQMDEEFQPAAVYTIQDLETLKVVADPLRGQILESLVLQPLTVKEVATRLGLAASKLYYHINLLEKHNLIQVVATRIVSGIIEKQYRATAVSFDLEEDLLSFATDSGKENLHTVITATIDTTREDLLRSLQARHFELEQGADPHPRRVILARELSRISEAQAAEFLDRLESALKEFDAADQADAQSADLQTYSLTIAFYPSFYFQNNEESS
jgi:DNA-binding transcriptional ArsR family regulator